MPSAIAFGVWTAFTVAGRLVRSRRHGGSGFARAAEYDVRCGEGPGGPRRGGGGFRRYPSRGWATTDTGELRALLAQRVLEWSAHAVVRAAERNLDHAMVSAALSGGLEVIEDYPRIPAGRTALGVV